MDGPRATNSEALRLLHLTDTHLFADATGELRGVISEASLSAVLEDIRRHAWPADAVLATGDFIQDDTTAAYRRCRRHLESLWLPVFLCPGNHDLRPVLLAELSGEPFSYCSIETFEHWSIISLDSCIDNRAGGRIGDAECRRLERHLDETDAANVLISLHHPPVALGSRWLDGVGLDNGETLLEIAAASGKVRGMVFGHAHQVFDAMESGIRLLCTPSTCGQFKPLSDEFATDDKPPAYRRLTLQADGTIDTDIYWVPHA